MGADDFHERRQSARGYRQAALAPLRREGIGVAAPILGFLGKLALDFLAGHLLPPAMRDFAEPIDRLDFKAMGPGKDGGSFHGAAQGRGKDAGDALAAEALREAAHLLAAFIREGNIGGAGEAILGGERRGAVTDEEDTGVGHCDGLYFLTAEAEEGNSGGWRAGESD